MEEAGGAKNQLPSLGIVLGGLVTAQKHCLLSALLQEGWKDHSTVLMFKIAHRIWKEAKQQQGTAGPGNMLGSCLVSFHFLWAILCPQAVQGGWG